MTNEQLVAEAIRLDHRISYMIAFGPYHGRTYLRMRYISRRAWKRVERRQQALQQQG
jgi:hypothetical protein